MNTVWKYSKNSDIVLYILFAFREFDLYIYIYSFKFE